MNRSARPLLFLFAFLLAFPGHSLQAQEFYAGDLIDVGLVVADLDEAVAFYEEGLGLERAYTFEVDPGFARRSGLTEGEPLNVVALKLRDEEEAPVLKLVQVGAPETYRPDFIDDQSGVRYLTFPVAALRPLLERLEQHGIQVLGEGPVELGADDHFALVQDPDGLFIELIGPMQASPASP